MAQGNPEQQALRQRCNNIESELNQAQQEISRAESEVNSLDASVGGLQARLAAVRGRGYAALGHLDKTIQILSQKWTEMGPSVRQTVQTQVSPMGSQVQNLRSEAQRLQSLINANELFAAGPLEAYLAPQASSVRSQAATVASQATSPIRDLVSGLGSVQRDLSIAESTVNLFGQAGFPMRQQESPVFAVAGKMLEPKKSKGNLYLTNQRFLFEGEEEVVVEKRHFLPGKKMEERVLEIDQPVGAVQNLAKGHVGLIAGEGIFVQLHPQAGGTTTPFEVGRGEPDLLLRFYRYIQTGDADTDIAIVRGVPPTAPGATAMGPGKPPRCPSCGAPPSGEIFRGQTSLKCEYCGAAIPLS